MDKRDGAQEPDDEQRFRIDEDGNGWVDREKREQFWAFMVLLGIPGLLVLAAVVALVVWALL